MLRTRNNTDGNKLVIFSGIALYYGDTYIVDENWHTSRDSDIAIYTDNIAWESPNTKLLSENNPIIPYAIAKVNKLAK